MLAAFVLARAILVLVTVAVMIGALLWWIVLRSADSSTKGGGGNFPAGKFWATSRLAVPGN